MRFIVTSDTHRDFYSLRRLVEKHRETTDVFIHLGDGAEELQQVITLYPECKWLSVRGNSDFGISATLAGCYSSGIAKIFYTHGHMYNVKFGLEDLLAAAAEIEANVVLFGHTHIPLTEYRNGVYIMNPGSLGLPLGSKGTYGVLDVTEKEIVCYINELELRGT